MMMYKLEASTLRRNAATKIAALLESGGYTLGIADVDLAWLLADIRHYCDANELDFAKIDRHAHREHYQRELIYGTEQAQ